MVHRSAWWQEISKHGQYIVTYTDMIIVVRLVRNIFVKISCNSKMASISWGSYKNGAISPHCNKECSLLQSCFK